MQLFVPVEVLGPCDHRLEVYAGKLDSTVSPRTSILLPVNNTTSS